MSRIQLKWYCLLSLSLAICSSVSKAQNASTEKPDGCKALVQSFYDWYVPVAARRNARPSFYLALQSKPTWFSRELTVLLKKDSATPTENGDLLELDFDPFLNTQDVGNPPNKYKAGRVTRKGENVFVDLKIDDPAEKAEKPIVTAELQVSSGRCVFTNFYYSESANLLTLLKHNRTERLERKQFSTGNR